MIESLGRGGAEHHLTDLLPILARRGVESEVASLMTPYDLAPALEERGIPVHRIDLPHRWHAPGAVRRLLGTIAAVRPDLIHAHLFFGTLYVALTRPFAPRPRRVVQLHNLDYEIYPAYTAWRRARRAIHRLALRYGMDARIAYARAVALHYAELRPGPIDTVPLGIDPGAVADPLDRSAVRRRQGVGPEDVWIVVPGRFVRQKGHRVMVEALVALRRQGLRPRVLMVGGGPLEEDIRDLIRACDLAGQVTLSRAVPHPELMDLLRAADLVVVPSLQEGSALVVYEALLAGTAVVATAVGGTPDVVASGSTGLLVPPGDPEALSRAIARLSEDPTERARLGAGGRDLILTEHSLEAEAAGFLRLYGRVLGKASQDGQ